MKQSPMLNHAIESFEHGLEHYLDGTDRSRKFALLHIDHAIELMIKEKCVMMGKSIFKSDGTTLGIHEAFNSLKKERVLIPEQPRLEDLHDLRNTIQHKGLIPDPLTAQFHVEIAYGFVKRFLEIELGLSLHDALPSRYVRFMEGGNPVTTDTDQKAQGNLQMATSTEGLNVLSVALRDAWNAQNPTSKIISGYSVLIQAVHMLAGVSSDDEKIMFRTTLREAAINNGVSESKVEKKLKSVLIIRSKALKPEYDPQENEAMGMLRAVESILQMVGLEAAIDSSAQQVATADATQKNASHR